MAQQEAEPENLMYYRKLTLLCATHSRLGKNSVANSLSPSDFQLIFQIMDPTKVLQSVNCLPLLSFVKGFKWIAHSRIRYPSMCLTIENNGLTALKQSNHFGSLYSSMILRCNINSYYFKVQNKQ